jgi:hypothetical protein
VGGETELLHQRVDSPAQEAMTLAPLVPFYDAEEEAPLTAM